MESVINFGVSHEYIVRRQNVAMTREALSRLEGVTDNYRDSGWNRGEREVKSACTVVNSTTEGNFCGAHKGKTTSRN